MKRITLAVVAVTVGATAGCKDLGLDGNVPLAEARAREPSPLVAAVMAPPEDAGTRVIVDGRLWVPWGRPFTLGPAESGQLRAVGSGAGETVYARAWDRPPYGTLFIRLPERGEQAVGGGERWIALAPVQGRTGAPGAAAEGEHGAGAAGTHDAAPPADAARAGAREESAAGARPGADHGGH